ncbi:MAG: hypothetical protein FWH29_11005 [Methanobrevibacter sp.]|nr:hypothetical protein [Methanobrevibacter sp.]
MRKVKKIILILVIIIAILGIWLYTNEPSKEDAEIEVISNGTWALSVTIGNETKEYTGDGNEKIDLGEIKVSEDVVFYITSTEEGTSTQGTLYRKGVIIESYSDTYVSTSSSTEDTSSSTETEYTTENSESTSSQNSYTTSSSSNSVRCWCGAIH